MPLGERSLQILDCIDSGEAIPAGKDLPTCFYFKIINRSVAYKLVKAGYVRKFEGYKFLVLTKKGQTAVRGRSKA